MNRVPTWLVVVFLGSSAVVAAQETKTAKGRDSKSSPFEIRPEKFKELHSMIKPYPGEHAWREEVPWQVGIREALKTAIAEDKPIMLLPSAGCITLGQT